MASEFQARDQNMFAINTVEQFLQAAVSRHVYTLVEKNTQAHVKDRENGGAAALLWSLAFTHVIRSQITPPSMGNW